MDLDRLHDLTNLVKDALETAEAGGSRAGIEASDHLCEAINEIFRVGLAPRVFTKKGLKALTPLIPVHAEWPADLARPFCIP